MDMFIKMKTPLMHDVQPGFTATMLPDVSNSSSEASLPLEPVPPWWWMWFCYAFHHRRRNSATADDDAGPNFWTSRAGLLRGDDRRSARPRFPVVSTHRPV